jgi:hypothetical protein
VTGASQGFATERNDPTYAVRKFTCIQGDSEQLLNLAQLCAGPSVHSKKNRLYTSQETSGPHFLSDHTCPLKEGTSLTVFRGSPLNATAELITFPSNAISTTGVAWVFVSFTDTAGFTSTNKPSTLNFVQGTNVLKIAANVLVPAWEYTFTASSTTAGTNTQTLVVKVNAAVAPVVAGQQFSDDYLSLLVMFGSTTDAPTGTDCTTFFADLFFFGTNPTCFWPNVNTLTLRLCSNPTATDGQQVTLKANAIQSAGGFSPYVPTQTLVIAAAANPAAPILTMTCPAVSVFSCSDFAVSAAFSGGLGRAANFMWTVEAGAPNTVLATYNTVLSRQVSSRATFVGLAADAQYVVKATATNWKLWSASATCLVTKSVAALPAIHLSPPAAVSLFGRRHP